MNNDEITNSIVDELEKVIDKIQHNLSVRGFNYTGFASNSLRIETSENRVTLFGADYIEFLETGRGKTNKSGSGVATKSIFKWVEDKLAPLLGITDEDEIESLKYAVAAKIHQYGTSVYLYLNGGGKAKHKKRPPLGIAQIVAEFENDINEIIKDAAVLKIKQGLDKFEKLRNLNYQI